MMKHKLAQSHLINVHKLQAVVRETLLSQKNIYVSDFVDILNEPFSLWIHFLSHGCPV